MVFVHVGIIGSCMQKNVELIYFIFLSIIGGKNCHKRLRVLKCILTIPNLFDIFIQFFYKPLS
jgi:hypothetical protein